MNVEGVRITVLEMEAHRIARVRVARGQVALEREEEEASDDAAGDAPDETRKGVGAADLPPSRYDGGTGGRTSRTRNPNREWSRSRAKTPRPPGMQPNEHGPSAD